MPIYCYFTTIFYTHPNWSYTKIQVFIDELAVFPIGNNGEIAGDYI